MDHLRPLQSMKKGKANLKFSLTTFNKFYYGAASDAEDELPFS